MRGNLTHWQMKLETDTDQKTNKQTLDRKLKEDQGREERDVLGEGALFVMFGQNIADLTEPRSVETKQNFFDRQVTFLIFEFRLQQEIDKTRGAQRGKAPKLTLDSKIKT